MGQRKIREKGGRRGGKKVPKKERCWKKGRGFYFFFVHNLFVCHWVAPAGIHQCMREGGRGEHSTLCQSSVVSLFLACCEDANKV